MSGIVRLTGEAGDVLGALSGRLRAASFEIEAQGEQSATLLVTVAEPSCTAISAATTFAEAGTGDRLIVHVWSAPSVTDWPAIHESASLAAFTRYAALAWAGRLVRVNAISLGTLAQRSVGGDDVASTLLAMWRWPSMTGQVLHLDPPASAPRFLPRAA